MSVIDIVDALKDGNPVSVDAFAAQLKVSPRTVRSYISQANMQLSGIASIAFSRRAGGYVMDVADEDALENWIVRASGLSSGDGSDISKQRVAYLLNDLLQRTGWVTVNMLAEMLYVSPQSISNDLRAVERMLATYGLTLARRPHYGVRVEGPEMPRRLCLAGLVSRALVNDDALVRNEGLDRVVKIAAKRIDSVLEGEDLTLSYSAFQNLTIHVAVSIERMKSGCYVPMGDEGLDVMRRAPEYAVAQRIAQAMEQSFSVSMPEAEIAYIAVHLAGKRTLASLAAEGADEDVEGVIPEGVWATVGAMLDRVLETFRFDLRDDLELRMNLARHLAPLAIRLRYGLRLENPILSEIKQRYPLAFSMAQDTADVLQERYGSKPSEDETGYIALALALALDRQRTGSPKKNIVVVCASGAGTARLLEASIRRQFGDRIGEVTLTDAQHVADRDFEGVDYVFTTVPLEAALPVPVQRVSVFLSSDDVVGINELLDCSPLAGSFLASLFSPACFSAHLDASTPIEAISSLSERLVSSGMAPVELPELVLAREEVASTAFGSDLALPHPIRAVNDVTRVCVGVLDRPIDWGGKHARLVMLVSLGTKDRDALDYFFGRVSELLSHPARVAAIVEDPTFDRFLQEFSYSGIKGIDQIIQERSQV